MIKVFELNKSFQDNHVIQNINFSIKNGEIFGLLGPNGAGKSTLIGMMSSILKCDSGQIIIGGLDLSIDKDRIKGLIGVVPQEISLYENFSAFENLFFWGKLHKIPSRELKQRIDEILELIGLENRRNDLIKTYSGGMKRRINIACSLLHQPKILFMDEPTVGVDPQSRNRIFDIVEKLNKQGMTIIYTTHYMEEVERLCDRIAIIDEGQIIALGTQSELQIQSEAKEYVELYIKNATSTQFEKLRQILPFNISYGHQSMNIECQISKDLSLIVKCCNKLNLSIEDLKLKKANLETAFLNLTGKRLRD